MNVIPLEIQKTIVGTLTRHLSETGTDKVWIDVKEFREIYDLPLSYVPILTTFLNYLYRQTWGKSAFPIGVTARREIEGGGRLNYLWEVQRTV
jgi:hypothetical protein